MVNNGRIGWRIAAKGGVYFRWNMHNTTTHMPAETTRQISPTINTVADLVSAAMRLRCNIGDGLNDFEFSEFIKSRLAPTKDGFGILCFSEGCLTLSVPPQNSANWYGDNCAIAHPKEDVARAIAGRHQLTMCEPPDKLVYGSPGPGAHRHLEFANRWNTVAVAHPLYIKLRVCSGGGHHDAPVDSEAAIAQCTRLMDELTELYQ